MPKYRECARSGTLEVGDARGQWMYLALAHWARKPLEWVPPAEARRKRPPQRETKIQNKYANYALPAPPSSEPDPQTLP